MKGLATLFGVLLILAFQIQGIDARQGRGAGPAAQGAAGGRGAAPIGGVDPILIGVIDTHMHSGPDSRGAHATHLRYEATLEDPSVYTRPWTISMPLYRRLEPDVQILEFKCAEYVEEMLWGNYRKQRTD